MFAVSGGKEVKDLAVAKRAASRYDWSIWAELSAGWLAWINWTVSSCASLHVAIDNENFR
jgi:hypothetical protein